MPTYEGWKNYETWTVQLIIDNDEPAYRERVEMTRRAFTQGRSSEDFAEVLQDFVTRNVETILDTLPSGTFASIVRQLVTADLSAVDWHEIAKNWLEEERLANEAT